MDYIKTLFKNLAKQNTFWTESTAKIKRTFYGQYTVSTNTTAVTFREHFLTCESQLRINNNFWKSRVAYGRGETYLQLLRVNIAIKEKELLAQLTLRWNHLFHSCNAVMQYLQRKFQAHTKKLYINLCQYTVSTSCSCTDSQIGVHWFTIQHYKCYFTYYRMSSVRPQKTHFITGYRILRSLNHPITVEPSSRTKHLQK
jgi:hypothetical protein